MQQTLGLISGIRLNQDLVIHILIQVYIGMTRGVAFGWQLNLMKRAINPLTNVSTGKQ